MSDFWERIRRYFETDDGACPEICLLHLSAQEVQAIYTDLLSRNPRLAGNPLFHDRQTATDKPVREADNVIQLLTEGLADPFHLLLQHVPTPIGQVPEIGVFFLPNAVAFDYEKGAMWGRAETGAFFGLLLQLLDLTADPRLMVDSQEGPDFPGAVAEALKLLREAVTAGNGPDFSGR